MGISYGFRSLWDEKVDNRGKLPEIQNWNLKLKKLRCNLAETVEDVRSRKKRGKI